MANFDKLLIVEDTPSLSRTYAAHLGEMFTQTEIVETAKSALSTVSEQTPSCILLDLKLPDANGLELLDRWVREELDAPIIVITANGSMGVAVDAMRRGAVDFVVKPTSRERLQATVKNVVETFKLKKTVRTYETEVNRKGFCDFVGRSLVMQGVYKTIEAAAPSKASVFVTGETGTGKELAARAVHQLSPRRDQQFVPINCGAIPKDLIESEIFGHVKGAFTGATSDRTGAAQSADGGTLFLDELGEMPIDLQPKLLRFIQTGEFARVGETATRKADIRIVAATNRNALQAVREGRLREDLYYRLHVIPISLPPLKERGSDILLLAEEFLSRFAREEGKKFTGFERAVEEWLVSQEWPGNVRELENLLRQIVVLNDGVEVSLDMLPRVGALTMQHQQEEVNRVSQLNAPDMDRRPLVNFALHTDAGSPVIEPLWLSEKKAIERAIAVCRGNITAAAELLEINPSTIYRKKTTWEKSLAG